MMDLGGSSVPGPRPYNEDNYLLSDISRHQKRLGGLAAFIMVSDGMGGHSSGDVASKLAVETATSYLKDLLALAEESDLDVDVPKALTEISEEAHDAIVAAATEAGGGSMGATFIAAFVARDRAWIGHVGDSRAYLISGGRARQLTVDHSQVGRLIAEGVLTEEQAQHHPSRNVIDRALGFKGANAEITEVRLRSGDAIVLCSDGVSTALSGGDIASIAAGQPDAMRAADALVNDAIQAGGDDNATAVIWTDDWAGFRRAAGAVAGRSKRGHGRRRMLPSRHIRAQRASFIAIGILLAIAVLFVGSAMLSTPPRGSSATPVAAGASTATSGVLPGSGPSTESALATMTVTVPGGGEEYFLRAMKKVEDKAPEYPVLATLVSGSKLTIVASTEREAYLQVVSSSVLSEYLTDPTKIDAVKQSKFRYIRNWSRKP